MLLQNTTLVALERVTEKHYNVVVGYYYLHRLIIVHCKKILPKKFSASHHQVEQNFWTHGSVVRAAVSNTKRGSQFESRHQQLLKNIFQY